MSQPEDRKINPAPVEDTLTLNDLPKHDSDVDLETISKNIARDVDCFLDAHRVTRELLDRVISV